MNFRNIALDCMEDIQYTIYYVTHCSAEIFYDTAFSTIRFLILVPDP